MMFIWVGAIVLVGVLAWRALAGPGNSGVSKASQTPEEVLKQRYARGEIDDAEFQRRMSALHH